MKKRKKLLNFGYFYYNPAVWEAWRRDGELLRGGDYANLYIGLKVGRDTGVLRKGDRITEDRIYGEVFEIRGKQVGGEYGSSFFLIKGHYVPREERPIFKAEKEIEHRFREDSVMVRIFKAYEKEVSYKDFVDNIERLAKRLVERLGQESIIVEYVRDGEPYRIGEVVWIEE